MTFMDEMVTAEIGQVGTQWDGLAHPMIRVTGKPGWKDGDYFYNKNRLQDVETARGMKKVGTEKAGGFFTRGILIDIAALKGVARLPKGYAITHGGLPCRAAEARASAMRRRATWCCSAPAGTACGRPITWAVRPARRSRATSSWRRTTRSSARASRASSPEVCDHLASKKISMIGSDTWGLEPYDFAKGVPESFAYCHMNLIARRGIYNFENLDLDELSADKAYEFLFAWAPLKLVGATGSPGNPVAAW